MSIKLPGVNAAVSALTKAGSNFLDSAGNALANKATQAMSNALNKAVGNAFDLSNTGVGKTLGKLGINADLSTFLTGTGSTGGWLAKAETRGDPLLQIDWYIIMPLGLGAEYVESVSVPKMNYGQSPGVFMAGQRHFFADTRETGAVSINFYEDNRLTALNYINTWKARVGNKDGTYNLPVVYKQPITLIMMDAKGNNLGRIVMNGCWPQNESPYEGTSGNSERVIVTVEFTCDSVDVYLNGDIGSIGQGLGSALTDTVGEFLQGGVATIKQVARNVASSVADLF